MLNNVRDRCDVIMNQMVFKFTKDTQAYFFEEMNQTFEQLLNFEDQLREVALQVSQGQFGRHGSGLNLDVNF